MFCEKGVLRNFAKFTKKCTLQIHIWNAEYKIRRSALLSLVYQLKKLNDKLHYLIKNKKYQTFARYFEQLDCTYFAL